MVELPELSETPSGETEPEGQSHCTPSFLERIVIGAITEGEVNTPTVIVINVVLGVGVVILSSALAVLYLGRELGVRREGTTRGSALGEIETHVGVLLVLSAGLLGAFNWFIAGLKGEESGSQSENDRDRDCDNEDTVDRKIQ